MILISHRGNICGAEKAYENKPSRVLDVINQGYDVEIDLWYKGGRFYLGHDEPVYIVEHRWLKNHSEHLWIHCKNISAVEECAKEASFHYFWHETDTITITSKQYIWAFPGKQPILNSIAVLPEIYNDVTIGCKGICSDNIYNYKSSLLTSAN